MRDEIVDHVITKKGSVTLNFGFGSLHMRNGATIEFKSITAQKAVEDQIPAASQENVEDRQVAPTMKRCDTVSQKSIAERSISFMQQR